MPIRPENRARYPKDWAKLSYWIRFVRAEGQCEFAWMDDDGTVDRCEAFHGAAHPETGSNVVLTVAHLDHCPENNDPGNLAAGCQRCHNLYDMPMRRAGIEARARATRALADLFEG